MDPQAKMFSCVLGNLHIQLYFLRAWWISITEDKWFIIYCIFQVKLSFLMVGHTHEDIDQMFSRLAVGLHGKAVCTLEDLQDSISRSYTPQPITDHLTNLWDYRSLAVNGGISLTGHSQPHCFRLTKKDDRVIMGTKAWSLNCQPYKELDVTELAESFTANPDPAVTAQSTKFMDNVERLRADIPKWQSAGKMSEIETDWWLNHLDQEVDPSDLPDIPLVTSLPTYARNARPSHSQAESVMARSLQNHIDSLSKEVNVSLRRRRS